MEARYAFQLIVRNVHHKRAIHDRSVLGTRPVGKPLGWMRGKKGEWFVQVPGGIDLPTHATMRDALEEMIAFYRKQGQ